jgi:hypothetical protein
MAAFLPTPYGTSAQCFVIVVDFGCQTACNCRLHTNAIAHARLEAAISGFARSARTAKRRYFEGALPANADRAPARAPISAIGPRPLPRQRSLLPRPNRRAPQAAAA